MGFGRKRLIPDDQVGLLVTIFLFDLCGLNSSLG